MQQQMQRGVRKRSAKTFCGLPLVDIAIGPDPEKDELRGYPHGVIAIGVSLPSVVLVSAWSVSAVSQLEALP